MVSVVEQEVYSKRIIAFIDILGFKEHIKKTGKDKEYAKKILKVMKIIEEREKDNYEGFLSEYNIGKEVTVFSDSVVISYPLNLGGSVFYVLMDLIHLQMDLIFHGILFRGGVVVGDLYHDRNTVFGKGMIDAYQLESNCAVYPRIILTIDTVIQGIRHTPSQNTPEMELEYILGLLRKDKDGFYYIDYLRQYQELDEEEYYYIMLKEARKLIVAELTSQTDKGILKKYKWLREYYNLTIEHMGLNKRKWKIPKR